MSRTWDPELYLKFQRERTQPSIDLVHRIRLESPPRRIIDIGCGPGNSTAVLRDRWPNAAITGLDSSPQMIAAATEAYPQGTWIKADARTYETDEPFNVVYSNAAIQWMPDHERLLERLLRLVAPGGALAVQVPLYDQMPVREAIARVASSVRWAGRLAGVRPGIVYYPIEFYYDQLRPAVDELDLWHTSYVHEMESHEQIIEMLSSTGMRPYLERLSEDEQEAFRIDAVNETRGGYEVRRNGRVLFPFRRLFFVAYRQ